MPEKQANEIKAAMANIKLPNIPPWAKQIPEQQWMSSLMENLTRTRGQGQCNVKGQDQTNHASTSSQQTIAPPSQIIPEFEVNFEEHFPNQTMQQIEDNVQAHSPT